MMDWLKIFDEYEAYKKSAPDYAVTAHYYSIYNIASYDCVYSLIYGERSNGKTYELIRFGIWLYVNYQKQFAYIRRWDTDFTGKRGNTVMNNHVVNGEIKRMTNGQYTDVYYYSGRWFLCYYGGKAQDKRVLDIKPFAYAFALNNMEHDKSTAYPEIELCIFDEFLARGRYLTDEFVIFMNVLSTIIRKRDSVKIFMLANTVNQYAPYFKEMGLKDIKSQEQGTIVKYNYGASALSCAVEYCFSLEDKATVKTNSKYFAFDNPKLKMITGGAWEMDLYPHCPMKYAPKDIIMTYFIIFSDDVLQCEIISKDNATFTYIHRKTTPIQDEDNDIIFEQVYDPRLNHFRNMLKPVNKKMAKLKAFFDCDMVYYQDNQVGEIVRNYLLWCKTESLK